MAESNRKCSRLGEWFVQEEIARAIDTALETIIGLSKRKQFKYHRGESLFALDFHTERHTSSLLPLSHPPLFILEGWVDTGIASLSSKSLLPCARRMISKWFVCIETRRVELTTGCVCLCRRESFFFTSWEYEVLKRNIHKQKEFPSKQKVYSLNQLLFFSFYMQQNSTSCCVFLYEPTFSSQHPDGNISDLQTRDYLLKCTENTFLKQSKWCSLGFKTVTMKPGLSLVEVFLHRLHNTHKISRDEFSTFKILSTWTCFWSILRFNSHEIR